MTSLSRAFVWAVPLCAICAPLAAAAQDGPRVSASATGTSVKATSVVANGIAHMSGTLYGGEGEVRLRSVVLRIGYSQGSLGIGSSRFTASAQDPRRGGVVGVLLDEMFRPGTTPAPLADLQLVEGYAFLGWSLGGFELGTGAQSRARLAESESDRLLLIVLRARYEAPIISHAVRAYAEGWNSLAGSASAPQGSGSGRGASAGAIARIGPVGLRVGYAVDRARYESDDRRESVEGLTISVGYRPR